MRSIHKLIPVLLLCFMLSAPMAMANNHPHSWQEINNMNGNFKAVISQPDIEVFSSPNIIMVKVNRTTQIRLFTILGKLISSQKLEPGIFEYHMDTPGIYIIKTDDISCKIAI